MTDAEATRFSRSFDTAAEDYDRYRPAYPDEVYDELARVAGGTLREVPVLDLAAGTGLVTRALLDRGAQVTSVDPGVPMLQQLASHSVGAWPVAGAAEALPVRDGAVDLVTCATAWHWLDTAATLAEVGRVLRPGGHLALWWANMRHGDGIEWEDAQTEVYDRWESQQGSVPRTIAGVGPWEAADDLRSRGVDVVVERRLEWTRELTREQHLAVLATHSNHLALGPADRERQLADLTAALAPWPTVTERIWGPLVVARFA